jgi:hypothetical protein
MMAMANAPPSRSPRCSNVGATGVGSPDGTGAISATPCSSIDHTATSTMPSTTATSGPGTRGTNRESPSKTATVTTDKAIVDQLTSPRSSTRPRTSPMNELASGSPVMPSSLGSWPAATVSPTPILIPVCVASEMLSMRAPSLSSRAISKITPTRSVSVARSRAGSVPDAATPAASSVEPVSTATVEVVLTDSVRDPPSRTYTTIGIMHV